MDQVEGGPRQKSKGRREKAHARRKERGGEKDARGRDGGQKKPREGASG